MLTFRSVLSTVLHLRHLFGAQATVEPFRGCNMKSPVVKRSIVVAGHKTSVSLEEAFWKGMKEISSIRHMTLSELVGEIDTNRQQGNLSSAIRLFVLDHYQDAALTNGATSDPRSE